MELIEEKTISILSNLITLCKNSGYGYKLAAEFVRDPNLKEIFIIYSNQKDNFSYELISEIKKYKPEIADDIKMDYDLISMYENKMSNGEVIEILKIVFHLEEESVNRYELAMNEELTFDLQNLITKQYGSAKMTFYHLKQLIDSKQK